LFTFALWMSTASFWVETVIFNWKISFSTEVLEAFKRGIALLSATHFPFGALPPTWIPYLDQVSYGPFAR
jgi:hypothetical protein